MKGFLFDENVPIPLRFVPSLPVIHATSLGPSPSDRELWTHAAQNAFVIVSKDADFADRVMDAKIAAVGRPLAFWQSPKSRVRDAPRQRLAAYRVAHAVA